VALQASLLPIAVRRYLNLPGPNDGAMAPCANNPGDFVDVFATEITSCLGTDSDPALRSAPNAGAAFDATNPGSDPTSHGPVVEILGQGAQPNGSSDFRGFIALDIRNFQAVGSQVYYNDVTSGTAPNTLKSKEAGWITAGGYPPPLPAAATTPPDAADQVAVMSGNATGIAIGAMNSRFGTGDAILVAVYPGQVMAIPDFTLGSAAAVAPLPTTGTVADGGGFRVGRNQAFSGQFTLSTHRRQQRPEQTPCSWGRRSARIPFATSPTPVSPSLGGGPPSPCWTTAPVGGRRASTPSGSRARREARTSPRSTCPWPSGSGP